MENKEITQNDIIIAALGENEKGGPKSKVSLILDQIKHNENVPEKFEVVKHHKDLLVYKPIVNIFSLPGMYMVDLDFKSNKDSDLAEFYEAIEQFAVFQNSVDLNTGVTPLIYLQIYPVEFNEEYYIIAANPFYFGLTPNSVSGEAATVRMCFFEDDFDVQQSVITKEEKLKMSSEVFNEIEKQSKESLIWEVKEEE